MSEAPETRGRQNRAEQVETERRRRTAGGGDIDPTIARFGIDPKILDHSNFVYRAASDEKMRLHNLTERDDWDFVTHTGDKADKADAAGVVRYKAGSVDGQVIYSYLLRKPKRYADADRLEKVRSIQSDQNARVNQGKTDDPIENAYVPKT